jgi:hypothetical protein
VNLWEIDGANLHGHPSTIVKPVDPAEYNVDPLTLL